MIDKLSGRFSVVGEISLLSHMLFDILKTVFCNKYFPIGKDTNNILKLLFETEPQ